MDTAEVAELLSQPEGEQLEFKAGEVRAEEVARILGAFANTRGGTLVWGFDERDGRAVGVSDAARAEEAVRRGLSLVSPQPDGFVQTVEYNGAPLVVARVGRTPGYLYLANRELLERQGDRTLPMSSARLAKLGGGQFSSMQEESPENAAVLVGNNKVLVEAIDAMREDMATLKKQNSFIRRSAIALAGAAFGALLRPIIELLT